MNLPTLEVYGSMECPYTFLATFRLREVWPAYAGRVRVVWRALSLEYVNRQSYPLPLYEAEAPLFTRIEAALPMHPWPHAAWQWPTTMWPAFEALACAQAQSSEAAWVMSWALRHAHFAAGRNLSLRHTLLEIAAAVADEAGLDVARFRADWDGGRYKEQVLEESQRGWHELKVNGSVTFVLPDGRQVTNPAIGQVDMDEERYVLRHYEPFGGDPLAAYRALLDEVAAGGGR